METFISNFHKNFYITEIRKVVFRLPYVLILGTHNCGNIHNVAFKSHGVFQDFLCCYYFAEIVVVIFTH